MTQGELETRLVRLKRIIEISRSLNSTLSREPLLHKILEAARELTKAEASSIMLVDRKSGELHFEAATGARSRELRAVVVPMDKSVAGWVAQRGQPLIINDVQRDDRFHGQVDEQVHFETRSLLAAPLVVKGKLIGVLEAVNKQVGESFSEEDMETLMALADQAAVAIENAVLFEQSDLVAEIVHEMRTPLTSIIGYAGIIQREDVSSQDRKRFADKIQGEAARLSRMTDDFLELARLESGRTFLDQERVSLAGVVRETEELLRPQAEEKQITLRSQLPENLPHINGDRQRLYQALINVAGNAVKYCGPGDRVVISAESSSSEIVLCVKDTGPGIPQEDQPRLFQKFYSVSRAEGREGTGLGLAITQQIIESHGGRIWVESEEGEGSAFYLALPLERGGRA